MLPRSRVSVTTASRTLFASKSCHSGAAIPRLHTPAIQCRIPRANGLDERLRWSARSYSTSIETSLAGQSTAEDAEPSEANGGSSLSFYEELKRTLDIPQATCSFQKLVDSGKDMIGEQVTLHGYLGTRRPGSKSLLFVELHDTELRRTVQVVSLKPEGSDGGKSAHQMLQDLPDHSPVAIRGTVKEKKAQKPSAGAEDSSKGTDKSKVPANKINGKVSDIEIRLDSIVPLNTFPTDIIMKEETVFPPEKRHLQIRNDKSVRQALELRSKAANLVRKELCEKQGFLEIETPLLFKSTPEGAREFLVPTRSPGLAYALPQSPQQYKQILMGSGIPRYMQIAKCFRDEDFRADRQLEFTQIDLEMAFASGKDVMRHVEGLIKRLWNECLGLNDLPDLFPRMTYEEAMSRYGSDKPDQRFGSEIRRIGYMLPVDLISKIGPLTDPVVEVFKMTLTENVKETGQFVDTFMQSPEAKPFLENPDGQPGIFIIDFNKPLQGLQAFGFEAAEQLEEQLELERGDLVVIQARKDLPFSGGSTPLGNLRLALHKAAVASGLIEAPQGFKFTWVTDFPLFSPTVEDEPGQMGTAGISSTHHPFTAPKTAEDVDLLLTDPLKAKADHYDLVVNGVELGGGSRRIHNAQMQRFVMSEVLKMPPKAIARFDHLLEVLRAGCPPHAGIALGFDRLIAVMMGKESVRDVIAFPKSGRGEDLLVKSPSMMTRNQQMTYHLSIRND